MPAIAPTRLIPLGDRVVVVPTEPEIAMASSLVTKTGGKSDSGNSLGCSVL